MANFTYALGPWVRRELSGGYCWDAPDHASGRICLGSLPDCALLPSSEDHRPVGLFCFEPDFTPSLDYLILGTGDCRELQPSAEIRQSAATLLAKSRDLASLSQLVAALTPEGDTIADWLGYWLFSAGDSTGQDLWKLGTPGTSGYEVVLAGHSRIWSAKFAYAADKRWNRLRDLLRDDIRQYDLDCKAHAKVLKNLAKQLRADSKRELAGKVDACAIETETHASKVLDWMCCRYRCEASELTNEIPRGKHATSYTETFNGADQAAFGRDLTWVETFGTALQSKSNQGYVGDGTNQWARCSSAVSSANHRVYFSVTTDTGDDLIAACSRYSTTADTHYFGGFRNASNNRCIYKRVAGSDTALVNDSYDAAITYIESKSDGTTQTGYANATSSSATDSAISGIYTGGVRMYGRKGTYIDNWVITDLVVPNPKNVFGGIMLDGPFRRVVFS